MYSRLHKGGTFIGSRRRRVATKKARCNRALKKKEKIRSRHCPSAEMPLRSVYEYDYDDTRSVGRFVPPRRSVLPRNGVGFACLPRKLIAADAFSRLTNLLNVSSLSSPPIDSHTGSTIGIFISRSWLQNLIIILHNYFKFKKIVLNCCSRYKILSKEEPEGILFRRKLSKSRTIYIYIYFEIKFDANVKSKKISGTAVSQNLHSEKYPRQIPKATRLQARNSLEERRLKFQTGKCRPVKFARPTSGE